MALDLTSILDSIKNLLEKNNTHTSSYYIGDGLNGKVKSFYSGINGMNESTPIPLSLYPAIFVELNRKSENYERLGSANRRDVDIEINIIPITNYGAGSSSQSISRKNADYECIRLSQNIEELIRNKISLSNTVSWVLTSTDYNYRTQNQDNTYNCVSKIYLDITKKNII